MGDKEGFVFEGPATPAEAADVLIRLAEAIRARALSLSIGEEEMTFFPDGDLVLEIEARERKDRAKIEVVIAWKRAARDEGEQAYA
jgi:amphi-Trp domain-containing protein